MGDSREYRHRTTETSVSNDWIFEAYDPDGESNVPKQVPYSVLSSGVSINIVNDTTPQLGGPLDGQGEDVTDIGVLTMAEQAAAEGDVAGQGQWWVKTATPNLPYFTDDAGTDRRLDLTSFVVAASDETTDLATGANPVMTFRMPYAFYVLEVRASVTTAPVGSAIQVDINEGGVSILSTEITIDATEKTSTTAATPAVVSDPDLADDAEITIDIDAVGSGTAGAGLKVALIGYVK